MTCRPAGGAMPVMLLALGCMPQVIPRSTSVEAYFIAEPVVDDCVAMQRRVDALGAWAPRLRRVDGQDVTIHPSDESWVLWLTDVPPPRTGRFHHQLGALTVACGGDHKPLRAVACRGGLGLRLYVDAAQFEGWRHRGTFTEGCTLAMVIDGIAYHHPTSIVLRDGLRERLGPVADGRARDLAGGKSEPAGPSE